MFQNSETNVLFVVLSRFIVFIQTEPFFQFFLCLLLLRADAAFMVIHSESQILGHTNILQSASSASKAVHNVFGMTVSSITIEAEYLAIRVASNRVLFGEAITNLTIRTTMTRATTSRVAGRAGRRRGNFRVNQTIA